MRFPLIVIKLVLLALNTWGQQNLVLNGDFEQHYLCPQAGNTPFSEYVPFWQNGGVTDTPDLFHLCSSIPANAVPCSWKGCQEPLSGDGYIGIWSFSRLNPDFREYVQTELSQPLYPGIRYAVSFHVSLSENYGGYAISSLGAALTPEPPDIILGGGGRLDVEPQVLHAEGAIADTVSWVLISDTIVSRGDTERYLTIGNFSADNQSDTMLFNPNASAWYVSYYFIDDVSVMALDSIPNGVGEAEPLAFEVWPNPAQNHITITAPSALTAASVSIYSISGQRLVSGAYDAQIDISNLPNGVYFIELRNETSIARQRFVKM